MIKLSFFYLFALSSVIAGVAIIFSTNIVRMAYWLIGMLLSVAGLYFLQGSYFLGVIQIIIYAGGVAVLMVFGVMLTSQQIAAQLRPRRWEALWLLVTAGMLLAGLVLAVLDARWPREQVQAANNVSDFGMHLLGKFLGPFELASILLLVALLGAAYLARPKVPTVKSENFQK
jgi:NADH-quinone oxidoreductase subunit J